MALWAVMAAPLIMSNDLQNVRPEIKAILQHKDIIAINKDPLGAHGKRVYKKDKIQIWVKPILPKIGGEESYAIVVLNRKVHWQPELFSIELKELGLNAKKYKQRVNIKKFVCRKDTKFFWFDRMCTSQKNHRRNHQVP